MNLTSRSFLPTPPIAITDEATRKYLINLHASLTNILMDIHTDISQGLGTQTGVISDPAVGDIDENQLVVRTDIGNEKLITKIDGVIKYINFS